MSNDHDPHIHWSYPTPLEPPEAPATLDPRVISINGMPWQARSDCQYLHDYYDVMTKVETVNKYSTAQRRKYPELHEFNFWRTLIIQDLWFFVYFVMKNPLANHPFVVEACKEVQNERGDSLEVWARDHLKTTIISVGRNCQKVFQDPEKRIGIFSATRPLALKIQNLIRSLFESPFCLACFPDILYNDPYKEAEKWSESPEGGLVVKRRGFYKEPTISSWGLIEGMPTGDHYTDMTFDDIVTQDLQSPEIIEKVKTNFDMAENLGTRDCQRTVAGTYYRHDDPLTYIRDKVDPATNVPIFTVRRKPATVDGSYAGKSVFQPERTLAKKRSGMKYIFYCQQLLDPTPRGHEKLNRAHLQLVSRRDLPERLYRFMLIDGSGDAGRRVDRRADCWALGVFGVEPYRDDLGFSRVFILDLMIDEMDLVRAQEEAVAMYCRNGRILKLGVEKVGMSTTEIHIAAALRAKKRHVSVETGNLHILRPGGRTKEYRIESAVSLPLQNGKIHVLDTVPNAYRERLMLEMDRFPASKQDDGLDILSYVYDIIKDYRFTDFPSEPVKPSPYEEAFRKAKEFRAGTGLSWIRV